MLYHLFRGTTFMLYLYGAANLQQLSTTFQPLIGLNENDFHSHFSASAIAALAPGQLIADLQEGGQGSC